MKLQIIRVRLCTPASLGRQAIVYSHIGRDSRLDDVFPTITFDKDARFLRIELGLDYFELVPMSNVASIMVEPAA